MMCIYSQTVCCVLIRSISRRLDETGCIAVMSQLVETGHAEWQDTAKIRYAVIKDINLTVMVHVNLLTRSIVCVTCMLAE
jgi:hypothetical protein